MKYVMSLFVLLFSVTASAANFEAFTESRFNELKASKQPFVVDVFATWCPTCKKQSKVMKSYFAKNKSSKLIVLKVNYDDQKPWVKFFKAPRQSTLVFYNQGKEVNRVIAQTNQNMLFTLMSSLEK